MKQLSVIYFPRLILCTWLSVFLLRLIPLGGNWADLKISTWIVILIWLFVYFTAMSIGVMNVSPQKNKTRLLPINIEKISLWVTRFNLIAIIGAILIIYEFAFIRGYGFSNSVANIRIMEVNASKNGFSGSWVSGIGRLLVPALMTGWMFAVLIWNRLKFSRKIFLFLASAIVFIQQYMYEGGRFYFAALISMIFIAIKFKDSFDQIARSKFRKKQILFIFFVAMVVIGFGYVFVNRYEVAGRDFYDAYSTWAHVFDLEQNEELLHARLSGESAGFWLGITMLWAYITQGFNELNVLLTSDLNVKAYGLFQFSQIGQVLAKLVDSSLKFDRFQNLPHTGTYITFYGASFVDFGFFGALLFSGFVGWLTGKSIKNLRMGRFNGLGLNAPLLITLGIFAPVISLVTNLWPAFFWTFFIHLPRFRLLPSTPLGKIQSQ